MLRLISIILFDLLIAPEGIEIWGANFNLNNGKMLLIAPEGIEMLSLRFAE